MLEEAKMRNTRFGSNNGRDADQDSNYAFGGSYKNKLGRPNSARQAYQSTQLTKGALAKFDQKTNRKMGGRPPIAVRKPLDPEVIANPGDTIR